MSAHQPSQASPAGMIKTDRLPELDYWLLVPALVLLAFGLVMVASASMAIADRITGEPFYFVIRHVIAIVLGLGAAGVVAVIPMSRWEGSGRRWSRSRARLTT